MCVIMQWCTIAMRDALCTVFKICTRYTNPVSARLSVHAGSSLYWREEEEREKREFVFLCTTAYIRRCLYLICFRVVKWGNLRKPQDDTSAIIMGGKVKNIYINAIAAKFIVIDYILDWCPTSQFSVVWTYQTQMDRCMHSHAFIGSNYSINCILTQCPTNATSDLVYFMILSC